MNLHLKWPSIKHAQLSKKGYHLNTSSHKIPKKGHKTFMERFYLGTLVFLGLILLDNRKTIMLILLNQPV